MNKEVRRLIHKEGGGNGSGNDIDEDIKDLVIQGLADFDREVEVDRKKSRIR